MSVIELALKIEALFCGRKRYEGDIYSGFAQLETLPSKDIDSVYAGAVMKKQTLHILFYN